MNAARADVIYQVARTLADGRGRTHLPFLVAIEGKSAAGKSTIANELADLLQAERVPVVRVEFDDFHPPDYFVRDRAEEWAEPGPFIAGAYAYDVFREWVIRPLRSGGDRRIRPRYYDTASNTPHPEEWIPVPAGAVVIVDGTFVLGPELRDVWDYVVWLDIDTETMLRRALVRDQKWIPDEHRIRRRYEQRWIPAHDYYESTFAPRQRADCVIDHRDFEHPIPIFRPRPDAH